MRPFSAVCSVAFCAITAVVLQGCGDLHEDAKFLVITPTASNDSASQDRRLAPARECSAKGENCRSTGCCSSAKLRCFEKDAFYASCRPNCTPGGFYDADPEGYRQPWTCRLLAPEPAGSCAAEHQRCSAGTCCDGLSCYEKDATWSGCKRSCTPGVDPTDPDYLRSPWSCRRVDTPAPVKERDGDVEVVDDQAATAMTAEPSPSPAWLSSHCRESVAGTEGPLQMQGLSGSTYAQGGGGEVLGDALKLHHNSGYSIMSTCRAAWAPDEFVQFRLLGRSISFEVDLSKVGCACNLAFYLVGGPALDEAGVPSKGECDESPYYCDANRVCGQWCPEIDIMEANNHVLAATPHKCDAPSNVGHFASCDRSGCAQNTRDMPGVYGPGPGFTINTLLPFVVNTTFVKQGSTLSGMTTALQQEGRSAVLSHGACDPGYLAQLSAALSQGMSLRITYWGDSAETMGWLDQPPCGQQTCTGGNAGPGVIGQIRVDPPQEGSDTRPVPGVRALPPPLPATEPREPTEHREPSTISTTQPFTRLVPVPGTTAMPVPGSPQAASLCLQGLLWLGLVLLGAYASAVVLLWCVPSLGPDSLQSGGLRRSGSACALRHTPSSGSLRPSGSEGDLGRLGRTSSRELRPSASEADLPQVRTGVSCHQLLSAVQSVQESSACKGLIRAVQAVNEVLRSRLCLCCRHRGRQAPAQSGMGVSASQQATGLP